MSRYERIPTTPRWSPKSDRLVELARTEIVGSRETNEVSVLGGGSSLLTQTRNRWRHDSPLRVRAFRGRIAVGTSKASLLGIVVSINSLRGLPAGPGLSR